MIDLGALPANLPGILRTIARDKCRRVDPDLTPEELRRLTDTELGALENAARNQVEILSCPADAYIRSAGPVISQYRDLASRASIERDRRKEQQP